MRYQRRGSGDCTKACVFGCQPKDTSLQKSGVRDSLPRAHHQPAAATANQPPPHNPAISSVARVQQARMMATSIENVFGKEAIVARLFAITMEHMTQKVPRGGVAHLGSASYDPEGILSSMLNPNALRIIDESVCDN